MLWVRIEHDDLFQVATEIAEIFDYLLIRIPRAVSEELVWHVQAEWIEFLCYGRSSVEGLRGEEDNLVEL